MPDYREAARSNDVPGSHPDGTGREALLKSLVPIGSLEHAPAGKCCCAKPEPRGRGGGSHLADRGIPSWT